MPVNASVLLLCINYRHFDGVAAWVRAAQDQVGVESLTLAIVNNEATPTLSQPGIIGARVRTIAAPENLGYFGAAEWACHQLPSIAQSADWIVVMNPDVRVVGRDFFARLVDRHGVEPPAVVAPRILTVGGRDENPFMLERPPSRRMHFYKWLFSHRRIGAAYDAASRFRDQRLHVTGRAQYRPAAGLIYAPSGSFMAFHRSYFDAGGSFKYEPFLYGEEILVAEFARQHHLRIVFDPDLVVEHAGHVSTGTVALDQRIAWKGESAAFLADTFFGKEGLAPERQS